MNKQINLAAAFLLGCVVANATPVALSNGYMVYTDAADFISYVSQLGGSAMFLIPYTSSNDGLIFESIRENDHVNHLVNCGADEAQPGCTVNNLYGQINGTTWSDHVFTALPTDPNLIDGVYETETTVAIGGALGGDFSFSRSTTPVQLRIGGTVEGYADWYAPVGYSGFLGFVPAASPSPPYVGVAISSPDRSGADITIGNAFVVTVPALAPEPSTWTMLAGGLLLLSITTLRKRHTKRLQ
jgi:hypothetical protein